jgi:hypothetical protein
VKLRGTIDVVILQTPARRDDIASLTAEYADSPTVTDTLEFPDTKEFTGSNPAWPTSFFENLSSGESHNESQRPAVSFPNSWSERSMLRPTHWLPGQFGALSRRFRRAHAQLASPISKVIAGPQGRAVRSWSRGSKAARCLPALPHRHQLVSAQDRPDRQLRTLHGQTTNVTKCGMTGRCKPSKGRADLIRRARLPRQRTSSASMGGSLLRISATFVGASDVRMTR